MNYKFFWGGEFSNFYPSPITVDGVVFKTTEHYFMAQKALTFNDNESYQKIMQVAHPKEAKKLGRKVANFDSEKWDAISQEVMFKGNMAKYTQNKYLELLLLKTGSKILVEASPYDVIWGIGLSAEDAVRIPENQWPGLNLLGKVLMKVRKELINK